ncbi:MAG: YraN family protein [bacterium]
MKKFTSVNQRIGELGEEIACKYLTGKGFSILERNYTKKWGEIDIIAEKGEKLYFLEVKSVSCETLPNLDDPNRKRPEENMHPWKMKRLSRTMQTYLIHNRIGNRAWQFDLVLVFIDMNSRKARVKILENIVL